MSEDFELSELDDAIIGDTCHCHCCGASFVLGGNDYIIVEVDRDSRQDGFPGGTMALCLECARVTAEAYEEATMYE